MPYLDKETLQALPSLDGQAPALDLDALPDDPFALFTQWFNTAVEAGCRDVRALTLATVDVNGLPNARSVNLLELDGGGFKVGTGADSVKSEELDAHPAAAMNFYWSPLTRAVRVRGTAKQSESSEGNLAVWVVEPTHVEFFQVKEGMDAYRIFYDFEGGTWKRTVDA